MRKHPNPGGSSHQNSRPRSTTRGLLVRVAIDSTSGGWNAPCLKDGAFCYVPMGSSKNLSRNYDKGYKAYHTFVETLLRRVETPPKRCLWPTNLPHKGHFDPDFHYCTHGEGGAPGRDSQRAKRIWNVLKPGDFIAFYASLRSLEKDRLVYSIIGFYKVRKICEVRKVPRRDWHMNAHTKHGCHSKSLEVVVYGAKSSSGRLVKHIPIGELRGGKYWIRPSLLREWGGLDKGNGYIQRSAFLPEFNEPKRFLNWFRHQKPQLRRANNIDYS